MARRLPPCSCPNTHRCGLRCACPRRWGFGRTSGRPLRVHRPVESVWQGKRGIDRFGHFAGLICAAAWFECFPAFGTWTQPGGDDAGNYFIALCGARQLPNLRPDC
jgi:hypothetical protein